MQRDFELSALRVLPNPSLHPATAVTSAAALTTTLTTALLESAAAQLPPEQQQKRAQWLSDGTLQLILTRRQTREQVATMEEQMRVLVHSRATRTRQQTANHQTQLSELEQRLHEGHQTLKLQRKAIKRAVRGDKQRYAETLAGRMMQAKRDGNAAGFWGLVKQVGKPRQGRPQQCGIACADGSLQVGSQQQAEAFREHFQQVLGSGQAVAEETLESIRRPPNLERLPPPTLEDVAAAVKRLKRNRALDAEGLSAELLQAMGREGTQILHQLVVAAWQQGMPETIKRSDLIPLHKKGDRTLPSNYRGIQLISIFRKVIALVISVPLTAAAEGWLLEYQCGFRPARSCADQLFCLRHLTDLALQRQHRLHLCFVDLQRAFDSLSRPALWAILRARGLPEQLVLLLQDLHTETRCKVRVGSTRSGSFDTPWGVQQGDPIAGLLFNIFIDHVVREALATAEEAARAEGVELGVQLQYLIDGRGRFWEERPRSGGSSLNLPLLLLADDLVAIASSARGLALFLQHFTAACQRWGLVISPTKTECMVVDGRARMSETSSQLATRCQRCDKLDAADMLLCDCCDEGWHTQCLPELLAAVPAGEWFCPGCTAAADASGGHQHISRAAPIRITVAGKELVWSEEFKYLGSQFNRAGSLDTELKRRTQQAVAGFQQLSSSLWRQKCIATGVKMQVYRVMVSQVLLYGSHSWNLTAEQLEHLEILQRQHFRRILGVRLSDRLSNETLLDECE